MAPGALLLSIFLTYLLFVAFFAQLSSQTSAHFGRGAGLLSVGARKVHRRVEVTYLEVVEIAAVVLRRLGDRPGWASSATHGRLALPLDHDL